MSFGRTCTGLALTLAFAGVVGATGCASAASDGELDSSTSNIDQREVAKELDVTSQVISDAPATPGNPLGIARWNAYVTRSASAEGFVAIATDDTAAKDVKYAVVVDAKRKEARILFYDAAGRREGGTLTDAESEALHTELEGLVEKLNDALRRESEDAERTGDDVRGCLYGLAFVAAAAFFVGWGGWVVVTAATTGALLSAAEAVFLTAFGGTMGLAGGGVSTAIAVELWDETAASCGRLLSSR